MKYQTLAPIQQIVINHCDITKSSIYFQCNLPIHLNGLKIEISNHMDLHILKFYTSVYENNIQKPNKSIKIVKIKLKTYNFY